jgi:hypothetical protein
VTRRPGPRPWARLLATLALATALPAGLPQTAVAAPGTPTLLVRTVPSLPHARVLFDKQKLRTGPDGTLRISPGRDWTKLRRRLHVPNLRRNGTRIRFSRWIGDIDRSRPPTRNLAVVAAFDVDYAVRFHFIDPDGNPVAYQTISQVELRAATGAVVTVTGQRLRDPMWLWGSRVITLHAGLQQKAIYYRLQNVRIRGANVVNQAQQRYIPTTDRSVNVRLLFFDTNVVVQDALFGRPAGRAVRVRYPDGSRERHRLGPGRTVTIAALPRGPYQLTVEGLGLPMSSPVSITRPQTITLKLVTWLDLAVGLLAGLGFLVGLPLAGRRLLRHPTQPTTEQPEPEHDLTAPTSPNPP